MLFKRDKDGLNGLDRAVQQAGVQLSRRKFLSSAVKWGAGLGLGVGVMGAPRTTLASECYTDVVEDTTGSCGSCSVQVTPGCDRPARKRTRKTRRCCNIQGGSVSSGPISTSTSCSTSDCPNVC